MGKGLGNRIAVILLVLSAGAGMGLLLPRALRPPDAGRPRAPAPDPPPEEDPEPASADGLASHQVEPTPLGKPLGMPSRRARPTAIYDARKVGCSGSTLTVSRDKRSDQRLEFTPADVSHLEKHASGARLIVLRSGDRVVVTEELTSVAPPALRKRIQYQRGDG